MKTPLIISVIAVFAGVLWFAQSSSEKPVLTNNNNAASVTPVQPSSSIAAAPNPKISSDKHSPRETTNNTESVTATTALTLEQKQDQEMAQQKALEAKIARIRQAAQNVQNQAKPPSPEFAKNMMDIFRMSAKGDWESLLNSTSEAELVDPKILDIAMLQAISHNAPITVIQTLLARGAQFTPEMVSVLAMRNNLALIKQLIPLGLDIHAVDGLGKNAIHHTFTNFQSKETFDFLLANGVSVNSSTQGFDLLDLALQRTINHADGVYYVQKLMEFNAKVSTSHKEILETIRTQNPQAYEQIQTLL